MSTGLVPVLRTMTNWLAVGSSDPSSTTRSCSAPLLVLPGVVRRVGVAELIPDVGFALGAVVGAAETADRGRELVALASEGDDGVAGRPALLAGPRVQLVISNTATAVTTAVAALRPCTRPPGASGASDRWA
jgi:hypothetical protein